MTKTIGQLTHQLVGSAALEPGLYGDGNNLYLRVAKDVVGEDGVVKEGGRSWVFIYRVGGKQRELVLVEPASARAPSPHGCPRPRPRRAGRCSTSGAVDPPDCVAGATESERAPYGQAAKDYIAGEGGGLEERQAHLSVASHDQVYCQPLPDTPCRSDRRRRRTLDPDGDLAACAGNRVAGAQVRIAAVIDHAMPVDSISRNPALAIGQETRQGEGGGKFIKRDGAFWNASSAAISPPCPSPTAGFR